MGDSIESNPYAIKTECERRLLWRSSLFLKERCQKNLHITLNRHLIGKKDAPLKLYFDTPTIARQKRRLNGKMGKDS